MLHASRHGMKTPPDSTHCHRHKRSSTWQSRSRKMKSWHNRKRLALVLRLRLLLLQHCLGRLQLAFRLCKVRQSWRNLPSCQQPSCLMLKSRLSSFRSHELGSLRDVVCEHSVDHMPASSNENRYARDTQKACFASMLELTFQRIKYMPMQLYATFVSLMKGKECRHGSSMQNYQILYGVCQQLNSMFTFPYRLHIMHPNMCFLICMIICAYEVAEQR